jgi:hypothetical protein
MWVLIELTKSLIFGLIFKCAYHLDVVKISPYLLGLYGSYRGVVCQTRKKPPASFSRY